jgi:cellulose synthase operon protein C
MSITAASHPSGYAARADKEAPRTPPISSDFLRQDSSPVKSLPKGTTLLALVAFAAFSISLATDARADLGSRFTRLSRLHADVDAAAGRGTATPLAYAALRRIWQEWDQGDPTEVSEVLSEVANDARIAAPIRAYASLLEAYGRRRRGDLEGAQTRIAALGYVGRWMIVGPFDNEGKAGLMRSFGPEDELDQPISIGRSYDGKERPVKWRTTPNVSPYGWFDLSVFVRPTENICAYASTYVRARDTAKAQRAASRPISIWAGSAGAMRVFWNDREVLRDEKYRQLDADRMATEVTLKDGWNRLLVKVCGDDTSPMVSLRLAGPDGAPDPRIEVDADPARGADVIAPKMAPGSSRTRAAALPANGIPSAKSDPYTPPKAGGVEGPLQAFERLIRGNDPAMLEAYARYLVITQSDDDTDHRARELARKAADLAPTIPRLLLAGELAEDRNQRASWIERAEARARNKGTSTDDAIAVVLARAAHARSGSNWRDAVPHYELALALDPDNVVAILARVELYAEAGLRETALGFLEKALARRPRSVALVRTMASALRGESRATEADEMAERYAQLRFDDPSFVRARIEFAVAHRNTEATIRWLDRFLASNPDSSSALVLAAHTYASLGEKPRAIAMYRRALDLAPEDTEALRALADAYALQGNTTDQIALLRKVLELRPQDKEVREYLAHTEPSKPRPDEVYARPSTEFLKLRDLPLKGASRRQLVDLQVTTVFPNGLASRFHQVVFQPLTDSAAAAAREYSFGFEADSDAVQLRGARVYRKDGQVDEAVETGEGNANNPSASMYTSQRAFYVHFPRLNAGDIVELQYRVEDIAQRNAFADYFGEVAYMQGSETIARAEYVLITPKTRTFYFNKPSVPGLVSKVEETADTRVFKFVAENVPAIEPEANQAPYGELLGHVHVSTYKDWNAMAEWYWGLVKDQFVPDDEVKRRVAEITKGLKDERGKVKAVYDYVVQKTRYVALEFGIHGFKPYRCAQIFARGFGDCKDKATLIVTMLRELNIPATIVIVRTGLRGQFETEPASLAPFDHAIAYVPSLDLYLDGTAEFTGSNELPGMDRGSLAIQINEGKPKVVHLPDPPANESLSSRKVEAIVAADGSAQIDWKGEVTGVSASGWRQRYHAATQRKARVQEDLATEFTGLTVATVDAGDLENIEQKVQLRARGKVPQLGRRDGDTMSIPAGPGEHMVREFAPLSQRHLDIKLPAQTTTENEWTIKYPASMRVTAMPIPAEGTSPFGTFKVEVEQAPSVVRAKTTITMTKTRIAANEYAAFKAWCEKVDRALGQRVIVAK